VDTRYREAMDSKPYEAALEAAESLLTISSAPTAAVVLGSGLGAFAEQLVDPITVSYADVPGFPGVGVVGHAGRLVIGNIGDDGPRVVAMSGRAHLYEGHSASVVVHPVRSLRLWGVESIVFTNAAGSIHPDFSPGELMLITDHINLTALNPLTGPNDDRFGTRFPDMSDAYDPVYCDVFRQSAQARSIQLREGVYAGLKGPSYETPAEIRMLGRIGADAVGMSTVCEVIAAHHAGMRVAGISCLTNYAAGLSSAPLAHSEVKETADMARAVFIDLLNQGLTRIADLTA
jgi:purine-nucleoside phosphorylase